MNNERDITKDSSPLRNGFNYLRQKAEDRLKTKTSDWNAETESWTREELQRALHDLQVHKIELEMQNEELLKIQQELNFSRTRFFDLYDLAPVGYCTVSDKGMILQANLTAAKTLNTERNILLRMAFSYFIHREDQDKFFWLRRGLLQSREPQQCELRIQPANGDLLWVQLNASVAYEENDSIVFHIAITDVSHSKAIENGLLARTAFFEAVVDSPIDGILVVDHTGEKVIQNKRLEKLWNIPRDIADSKDDRAQILFAKTQTKDPEQFMEGIVRLYADPDRACRDEIELINGTFLDRYSSPVVGKDGQYYGRVWAFRDITEAKKTALALQQSEQQLRLVTNHVPGPVARLDRNLRYIFVNSQYETILGITRNEMIGKTIQEVFGEEVNLSIHSRIERVLRGEKVTFENLLKTKRGEEVWLLVNLVPDINPLGDVIGFFIISIEITDRKKAEMALRDSEQRWKFAIEGSGDGLWDWDIPSGTVFFSKRWKEMLGYRENEIGNRFDEWDARIHPDDRERIESEVQKHFDGTKQVYEIEHRVRTKDGSWKWILARGVIVSRDKTNQPVRMIGTHTDITARKETEVQLQLTTELLEEAQSVNRMGNWSFDVHTKKSIWSKQLFSLFGFASNAIEPDYETTMAIFLPEDSDSLDKAIRRALDDGTPYSHTLQMRNPTIEVRHVRCEGRARRDPSGKIIGLYGTVMDVTQEVEKEQALQVARNQADAANRAKSEFLANMSHEIRTPLTAILGFAEVLREDGNLTQAPLQRLHNIDTITSAGQHLLTIINDILDLSKIEADKIVIELIEMSLPDLLREVEQLLQPKAHGKGLALETQFSMLVPSLIMSDPTRFRQILMNLVGNAAKFTEAGKIVILVSTLNEFDKDWLVIDVEDTGPGISELQSKLLFQAFEQIDSTVTRRHGGTGLGLTISRRLAQLMGGDVKLLWTTEGKGSCFRLMLPLIPTADSVLVDRYEWQSTRSLPDASSAIRLNGRILLVEDGIDNQRLISFVLKKAGAVVVVAEDGLIALGLVQQAISENAPYDLLLTDMQMPVMDGYVLAKTLRDQHCRIPIVALTAHALAEDREKCLEAGCDDYVTKPIDKQILLSVCSKWMVFSEKK